MPAANASSIHSCVPVALRHRCHCGRPGAAYQGKGPLARGRDGGRIGHQAILGNAAMRGRTPACVWAYAATSRYLVWTIKHLVASGVPQAANGCAKYMHNETRDIHAGQ